MVKWNFELKTYQVVEWSYKEEESRLIEVEEGELNWLISWRQSQNLR